MSLRQTSGIIILLTILVIQHSGAYNLSQIPKNSDLSNSSVTDFCQNENGLMLIGTCDGLNFYNSRDVFSYQPKHEYDFLSGNIIDKIIYTGNDIFWIQTYYGLNKFDLSSNKMTHYNDFQKLFFIEKDQQNNLFIIRESNSIFYYHKSNETFKKLNVSGIAFSDIMSFFIDSNNVLWIITKKGYKLTYQIEYNGKNDDITIHSVEKDADFHDNLLHCFYEDDQLYIIDKEYNLHHYNVLTNQEHFVYNLKQEIHNRGKVAKIIRYHDNFFIGFITNGLIVLEKDEATDQFKLQNIEINSGIFSLQKDNLQDIVWIGTDGQGVYAYTNTTHSIRSYILSNFSKKMQRPVRAILLDKNNTLWIGSKGDGIMKINDYDIGRSLSDSKIDILNSGNSGLKDNLVYAFGKSKSNVLWIGSEHGLSYYSYRTNTIHNIKLDILNNKSRYIHEYEDYIYLENSEADANNFRYIHSIYETADSKLWLTSVGLGVICADIVGTADQPKLTNIQHYSINNGDFESNYFFSIYAEKDSLLWFANRGYGPFQYNRRTDNLEPVNYYHPQGNQTINDVFSIIKDDNGAVLIGTGFGLVKQSPDNQQILFNTNVGFKNNSIHAIEPGDENTFWLSTNKGLVHFNSNNNMFRIYEKPDGLAITEFSDGASFKDYESNTLFFGGINGFVAIQKDHGTEKVYMPQISFSDLSIFGEKYNIKDFLSTRNNKTQLELRYRQNFFSVSFTAIDFINEGNYTYFYKIDELSNHWINNGGSNSAAFSNLAPGNYTLETKYYNRTLNQESDIFSLKIKILPPWYLSKAAYFIYWILSIILIVIVLYYLHERHNKKEQKMLEELEEKHQKEVYESKLQFFTNIAHEFCTPLTLISGPCERILAQPGVSKSVSNYVRIIQTNAERLNNLILELIEFRRIETGNREIITETVDVSDSIQYILDMFSEMVSSKNINLLTTIPEGLQWNTDKSFLITIFTNLISNAFKYTPNDKSIKIDVFTDHQNLTINIANEGNVIPETNFKDIFNRYTILDTFENQSIDSPFSRNGLGLAILNNMVHLLDGSITVTNTQDGFVMFTVILPQLEISDIPTNKQGRLPFYTPKIERYQTIQIPEYTYDREKSNMLVIDDDEEILWLISELFSEEFNVLSMSDPQDIEQVLTEMRPHIILCDIVMPNISGIELTKNIKNNSETSHIPIIIISGNYEIDQQIDAMEAGAEMYINKPFDTKFLQVSVKKIIDRKKKLEDYYSTPISSYEFAEGKLMHKEHKKFLHDVLQIVSDNITNKELSTPFVAKKLNISQRSLYRKMNEIDEVSVNDLIRDCRVQFAANLLTKTKLTVEEVCFKAGFANRSTFFKAFNTKYECTPKIYRENHEKKIT